MPELDTGFIVIIVLGSVLVVLLFVFVLTCLLLLKKKRLLCFRSSGYARPFLHSDKELLSGRGRKGVGAKRRNRNRRSAQGKKKSKIYQSISKGLKFPKRDPFASNYLENPMVDMEELDTDWTNPAFDKLGAQKHDAVVAIQSWYRMIRYGRSLARATLPIFKWGGGGGGGGVTCARLVWNMGTWQLG